MASLYVTEQGATLAKTGGRIVVRKDNGILKDIPSIHLDRVVVFGVIHITTPAIRYFLQNNIDVAYMSIGGKYHGRLQPPINKNSGLRRKQYLHSEDSGFCLERAKEIIDGKIHNALVFCQRNQRQWEEVDGAVEDAVYALKLHGPKIRGARDLNGVRGYEGFCAKEYFKAFKQFLNNDMGFEGRCYHPPLDPINAILSLGYTLLFNVVFGAVSIVGLDPYQGFLHSSSHGNAALVSDLMEEWRTILVDSMVVAMINRSEIGEEDFDAEGGKILLSREGLKKFLGRFDDGMSRQVYHPVENKKYSYRQCVEIQVRKFADVILGKEKTYRPFLSR